MAIRNFRHRGLSELFHDGRSKRVRPNMHKKCIKLMDLLDAIGHPNDLVGVSGFHKLTGDRRGTFAMSVTGNWRLVFGWDAPDVIDLDLEDYH